MSAAPATSTPNTAQVLGTPIEFVIPREGDRDLAFKGWRLSQVKDCQESGVSAVPDRCTEVSIYLTGNKNLVTHVRRWNQLAGKPGGEQHLVGVHSRYDLDRDGYPLNFPGAVEAAIKWLKKDNGGRLGALSKQAWTQACQLCPDLNGEAAERVE